jgi:hypothetical protein
MAKVMRIAFVLGLALSLGTAATEPSAASRLRWIETEDLGFRGCDRDWNPVNNFWTSNPSDLYRLTSTLIQEADFRACDRDWKQVVDVSAAKDSED